MWTSDPLIDRVYQNLPIKGSEAYSATWYHWVTQKIVIIDGRFQNDLDKSAQQWAKKSKKVQYLALTCQIWKHCGMELHVFARICRWAAPAGFGSRKIVNKTILTENFPLFLLFSAHCVMYDAYFPLESRHWYSAFPTRHFLMKSMEVASGGFKHAPSWWPEHIFLENLDF